MGVYRLSSGRVVRLVRCILDGTYNGVLEGTTEGISKAIRKDLPRRAASMLPPGQPLAIVEPPEGNLPPWMCVAEFESRSGVRNTDPDFHSQLYVFWFLEDTARSLDDMINSILPQIDWEMLAEDFDFTLM